MLILYVKKEESVKEYPLNLTGPLDIKALPGHCYTLRDPDTGQAPEGMVIKRLGDDLEIRVNDTPVVTLARFFQEDDPDPSVFSTDGSYAPPEEMMVSGDAPAPEDTQIPRVVWEAPQDSEGWAAGLLGAGLLGGGGAALISRGSDGSGTNPGAAPFEVRLDLAAGPVSSTLKVEVYDDKGNLLATRDHDFSTGRFTCQLTDGYTGPVLVKVMDTNSVPDYLDETTGEMRNIGTPLRAMAMADGRGHVSLTVTPVTELSVRLAGIPDTDFSLTPEHLIMNHEVGALFGVTDITGPVTTTLDPDYDPGNGVDDAEAYGRVLAMFSGMDQSTGSLGATLDSLVPHVRDTGAPAGGGCRLALDQDGVECLQEGVKTYSQGGQGNPLTDLIIQPPQISAAHGGISGNEQSQGVVIAIANAGAGDTVMVRWGDQTVEIQVPEDGINAQGLAEITIPPEILTAAGDGDELGVSYAVNQGPLSPAVLVDVDTTAPEIHQVSLAPSGFQVGDIVTVTLTVADDGGDVYTQINGNVGGYPITNLVRVDATTYTARFTITEGGQDLAGLDSIPVELALNDTAGNQGSHFTQPLDPPQPAVPDVFLVADKDGVWLDPNENGLRDAGEDTAFENSGPQGFAQSACMIRFLDAPDIPADLTGFGSDDRIQIDINAFITPRTTKQVTRATPANFESDTGLGVGRCWYLGTQSSLYFYENGSSLGYLESAGFTDLAVLAQNIPGPLPESAVSFVNPHAAPSPTILTISISDDTGASDTDLITRTRIQTVTTQMNRALNPGDKVMGSLDDGNTWTDITDKVSGSQIIWDNVQLLDGTGKLSFYTENNAGQQSRTVSETYTLDTAAPTADLASAGDDEGAITGPLSSGDTTDDTTPVLSGTCEAGSTVQVYDGTTLLGQANVTGTAWTFTPALPTGTTRHFNVKETDLAGNTSAPSADFILTGGADPVPVTTISGIDISKDTGASDSDFNTLLITQDITAVLSAELTAGESLMGSVDNGTTWTDITGKVSGTTVTWDNADLADGSSAILFKVVNAGGSQGPQASQAYTVDTGAYRVVVTDAGAFIDADGDGVKDADETQAFENTGAYKFLEDTVTIQFDGWSAPLNFNGFQADDRMEIDVTAFVSQQTPALFGPGVPSAYRRATTTNGSSATDAYWEMDNGTAKVYIEHLNMDNGKLIYHDKSIPITLGSQIAKDPWTPLTVNVVDFVNRHVYDGERAVVTAGGVFADPNGNGNKDGDESLLLAGDELEAWLDSDARIIDFDEKPDTPIDLTGFSADDRLIIDEDFVTDFVGLNTSQITQKQNRISNNAWSFLANTSSGSFKFTYAIGNAQKLFAKVMTTNVPSFSAQLATHLNLDLANTALANACISFLPNT